MTAERARTTTRQATIERERRLRRHELALGYRLFAVMRWGDLGDGHITARDPELTDHFWQLRRTVGFERARADDMVLVGPDGSVVDGSSSSHPADATDAAVNATAHHIHWPIHEARPDVVAAAHTHTPWGTPFCAERRLVRPITQEACNFIDDQALFDDEEVQILGLDGGRRIASALGSARVIFLANHGLLTTGGSVASAVAAFVMLERVCEAELKATGARPIGVASARLAKADLDPDRSFPAAFDSLVARHLDLPREPDGSAT